MVRFARAKGSKGANERQPEDATSWQELKQQMRKPQEYKGNQFVESAENNNEEDDYSQNATWAQFEETVHKKKAKKSLSADGQQKSKQNNKKTKTTNEKFGETLVKDVSSGNSGQKLTLQQKKDLGLPATRRKPIEKIDGSKFSKMIIGSREIEVGRFLGYMVKREDWERLTELKKKLEKQKAPKEKIEATLKMMRRRAEKAFARERKKVCFNCREQCHNLSECPLLKGPSAGFVRNKMPDTTNFGMCFKCGSTEHTYYDCKVVKDNEFKFASCFVCHQQGHISRQCPDNPQGMYPKGGSCNLCGEVTHLRRHCPKSQKEKPDTAITLPTMNDINAVEALDNEMEPVVKKTHKKKKKVVKF